MTVVEKLMNGVVTSKRKFGAVDIITENSLVKLNKCECCGEFKKDGDSTVTHGWYCERCIRLLISREIEALRSIAKLKLSPTVVTVKLSDTEMVELEKNVAELNEISN